MPSKLPRLNVVMTPEMRQWLEEQRQPCESAAHVVRRIVAGSMATTPSTD
jgi:hypothetical protein